jgi:hypothetical protein
MPLSKRGRQGRARKTAAVPWLFVASRGMIGGWVTTAPARGSDEL